MNYSEESIIKQVEKYTDIKKVHSIEKMGGGKANMSYSINENIFLQINNNISSKQELLIEKVMSYNFVYFAKNVKNSKRFYSMPLGRVQIMKKIKGRILSEKKLTKKIIDQCFHVISKSIVFLQQFDSQSTKIYLEYYDNNNLIQKLNKLEYVLHKAELERFLSENRSLPSFSDFTKGLIHSDTNFRNLLEHNGEIVGLIDYEFMHSNILLFDIADFHRSLMKLGLVNLELIDSSLEIYKKYNSLSTYEEENFIYLIKYLIINTGLHYYLSYTDKASPYFEVLTLAERLEGFMRCIGELETINMLIRKRYD